MSSPAWAAKKKNQFICSDSIKPQITRGIKPHPDVMLERIRLLLTANCVYFGSCTEGEEHHPHCKRCCQHRFDQPSAKSMGVFRRYNDPIFPTSSDCQRLWICITLFKILLSAVRHIGLFLLNTLQSRRGLLESNPEH